MIQQPVSPGVSPLELRGQIERCSLAALEDTQVERLAAASEARGFVLKGSVWEQPETRAAVLLVTHGRFRIERRSKDSARPGLCQLAHAGELIGISRLVAQHDPAQVFADVRRPLLQPPRAIVMPCALLSAFLDENRAFARALLGEIQAAADELAAEIVALRCDTFAERALARIERRLGQNSGELDWSQADLAQLVGGTRFDVSRELGRLAPFLSWPGKRGRLVVTDLREARRLVAYRKQLAHDAELHRGQLDRAQ